MSRAFAAKEGWAWSLIAVLIGIFSIVVGVKELRDTQSALQTANELSQKKYATDLITQWNKDTREPKLRVHQHFPWLVRGASSEDQCLCSDWNGDWEQLYLASAEGEELHELREDIVWMLNYFEAVAVAHDRGLADSSIIEDSLRPLMLRWHECFGPFMMQSFLRHGQNSWWALSSRVRQWQSTLDNDRPRGCADRAPELIKFPAVASPS